MEKHIPIDGDKQEGGLLAIEGRNLGNNSKPMVEVSDKKSTGANPTTDKLRAISNRIECAELGKISVRSRGGMDTASDYYKEDLARQTGGMLDDGQPASGKNDPVRGAKDQWNNPDQGNARFFRGNQALNNFILGEVRVEDGASGSMEIERH